MRRHSVRSTQLKDEMAKDIGGYECIRQNCAEGRKYPVGEKDKRDRSDEAKEGHTG